MPKPPLLNPAESQRLWLMTELCDRDRRMVDELLAGISEAGAYPGILRSIDPSVEDALWFIENAVVKELVLGLLRLADPHKDALSLHKVHDRLHSGMYAVNERADGGVGSAINAYLTAVEPMLEHRDRMLAHPDRNHPQSARFQVQRIDNALKLLVRALQVIDAADGRPARNLVRRGSARTLGFAIGEGMVARARREQRESS